MAKRAKQHAKLRGVAISEVVEAYLTAVADPTSSSTDAAPILHSVRGVLKNGNIGEYRKHLAAIYR